MKSQRPYTKALICLVLFLIVASLDYVTGYEVTSFPLYFAPIMLAFFYFGKTGGYVAVGVATIVWFTNDFLTGHTYNVEAIRYWNAAARLIIYGFFVYALSTYTRTVEANRRRMAQMQALMPICHTCGKVLCPDGQWRSLDEAFEQKDLGFFSCGGCPTPTEPGLPGAKS